MGRQLVLQDFAGMKDPEASLRHIESARQFMKQHPSGSVLLVTDVTGSSFDRRIIGAMRDLAANHKPYVAAAAIVGLSPLARIAYSAITRLTGRTIRAFDDLEAAKDWLVAQSRSA